MYNIIKKILLEETQDSFLTKNEVLFFKFLNIFKQSKQSYTTRQEILNLIRDQIGNFGLDSKKVDYYYDLYTANFREDGRYDLITQDNLKKFYDKTVQKRTTNTNAKDLVNNLKPFRGSNLTANWEDDNYGDWGYVVLSYDWYPIYIYKYGKWFEVESRYSMSTAKHMSNVYPSVSRGDLIKLSENDRVKLRKGWKDFSQGLESKKQDLLNDIENMIQSGEIIKVRTGWYPRLRISFKYESVNENNETLNLDVRVTNVEKVIGNSIDRSSGDFFMNQMEGVTRDTVKDYLKEKINEIIKTTLGFKVNINLNISFE